jgi:hypothetical protein
VRTRQIARSKGAIWLTWRVVLGRAKPESMWVEGPATAPGLRDCISTQKTRNPNRPAARLRMGSIFRQRLYRCEPWMPIVSRHPFHFLIEPHWPPQFVALAHSLLRQQVGAHNEKWSRNLRKPACSLHVDQVTRRSTRHWARTLAIHE